jgi:hypothetical protein
MLQITVHLNLVLPPQAREMQYNIFSSGIDSEKRAGDAGTR